MRRLLFIFAFIFQFSVLAQTSTERVDDSIRLAFVDFHFIMNAAPQLEVIGLRLQGEFANRQKELETLQEELQVLEEAVAISSAEEYDKNMQHLIAKRRELARERLNFQDDLNVRRNEELAILQGHVLEEITLLAQEQGFDVVLNNNGVIYASERADLTQEVMERLRAQLLNEE